MSFSKEELEIMLKHKQMSSGELKTLLEAREESIINFVLIDIREMFEYSDKSIKGTDLLLPTSRIHTYLDKFESMKDKHIVLYCRTGNRTGQLLTALQRMGYQNIVHLSSGIVAFSGETLKNAPLPNEL